jgi:hypothetical protein
MLWISERALNSMYWSAKALASSAEPLGSPVSAVTRSTFALSSAATSILLSSVEADSDRPSSSRTALATSDERAIRTLVAASRSGSTPPRSICSAASDRLGAPKTTLADAS